VGLNEDLSAFLSDGRQDRLMKGLCDLLTATLLSDTSECGHDGTKLFLPINLVGWGVRTWT
jgi:hypothetical protein